MLTALRDHTRQTNPLTAAIVLAVLALDDSVTLTGFVEDVRIPVAEAEVAVTPIREGGGTRLKILEAMALGTPVVATSKGAEGLDVIPDRHILIADSADKFAGQVTRLLRDDDLRRQLACEARRLVERKYDWGSIGKTFVELIENVVAEQRSFSTSERGARLVNAVWVAHDYYVFELGGDSIAISREFLTEWWAQSAWARQHLIPSAGEADPMDASEPLQ